MTNPPLSTLDRERAAVVLKCETHQIRAFHLNDRQNNNHLSGFKRSDKDRTPGDLLLMYVNGQPTVELISTVGRLVPRDGYLLFQDVEWVEGSRSDAAKVLAYRYRDDQGRECLASPGLSGFDGFHPPRYDGLEFDNSVVCGYESLNRLIKVLGKRLLGVAYDAYEEAPLICLESLAMEFEFGCTGGVFWHGKLTIEETSPCDTVPFRDWCFQPMINDGVHARRKRMMDVLEYEGSGTELRQLKSLLSDARTESEQEWDAIEGQFWSMCKEQGWLDEAGRVGLTAQLSFVAMRDDFASLFPSTIVAFEILSEISPSQFYASIGDDVCVVIHLDNSRRVLLQDSASVAMSLACYQIQFTDREIDDVLASKRRLCHIDRSGVTF